MRNIRQNLFFAFFYNVARHPDRRRCLYPFFGLLLNPMIAGAAMSLSSVSVIANALRLRGLRIGLACILAIIVTGGGAAVLAQTAPLTRETVEVETLRPYAGPTVQGVDRNTLEGHPVTCRAAVCMKQSPP